jgi:hypothetical protein
MIDDFDQFYHLMETTLRLHYSSKYAGRIASGLYNRLGDYRNFERYLDKLKIPYHYIYGEGDCDDCGTYGIYTYLIYQVSVCWDDHFGGLKTEFVE